MKSLTRDNWIPVEVSLPDTHRTMIVQTRELPDPTIASYWGNGKWSIEEDLEDGIDGDFNILAWRDYPKPYKEKVEEFIFRTANEARTMTFNAKKRIASGNENAEFFYAREKVLRATITGAWETYFEELSPKIVKAFKKAGFNTIKEKRGYTISWRDKSGGYN